MDINDKINDCLDLLQDQMAWSERPAVACSFGKDSMVLLYLAQLLNPLVSVAYFEGFPHPTKHAFSERITAEWGLSLIKPTPMGRDAIRATDGRVEIVEAYRVGPKQVMYFPLEAEPGYAPDASAMCGREKRQAPVSDEPVNFDAVFVGHRGDDVDPTHGAVPLDHHIIDYGDFRLVYPLKDWTEADIWHASHILDIPQNDARYIWRDMSANADYWPLCTKCLPGGFTICPQTGEAMHTELDPDLDQRAATWRQTFVNIKSNAA